MPPSPTRGVLVIVAMGTFAAVLMLLCSERPNNNEIIREGDAIPGAEVYATAGDPRRVLPTPQAGQQSAVARVNAMTAQYPHTWDQGAVHQKQYPYPEDGPAPPPPQHQAAAPRDAKEAVAQTDAAVAAVDASRAVHDSEVPAVTNALGRMGKDLAAPVAVPASVAPTVPTPPKDMLSKVVPVPPQRRTVTWQQAQAIKSAVHAKVLQETTKRLQEQLSKPPTPSEEITAAETKELQWKPAYIKAQQEAAQKREAALNRAAEAQRRAAAQAEKETKAQQLAGERNQKHEQVAANIQEHMNSLRTLVPNMDQISTSMHEDEDGVQTAEIEGKQKEEAAAQAKIDALAAAAAAQKVKEQKEDASITASEAAQEKADRRRVERLLARQAEGTAITGPPGAAPAKATSAKENQEWEDASTAEKRAAFDGLRAEAAKEKALAYVNHEKDVITKTTAMHVASEKKEAQYTKQIAAEALKQQARAIKMKEEEKAREQAEAAKRGSGEDTQKALSDAARIQSATEADVVADDALKGVATFRASHPKIQAEAKQRKAKRKTSPVLASAGTSQSDVHGINSEAAESQARDYLSHQSQATQRESEVEEAVDEEANAIEDQSSKEELEQVMEQAWQHPSARPSGAGAAPPLVLLQEDTDAHKKEPYNAPADPTATAPSRPMKMDRPSYDPSLWRSSQAPQTVDSPATPALEQAYPNLEKTYPWLHRVVEATDPAIEARTAATLATAARIKAEREAVQATTSELSLNSEAVLGLRRLDTLHAKLASMSPGKEEPGDTAKKWTPQDAKKALLQHAMTNAEKAYAATTPTYQGVVASQEAARQHKEAAAALAKQQAAQQAAADFSRRTTAHEAFLAQQAQEAARVAAVAAQDAAEDKAQTQEREGHLQQETQRHAQAMQGIAGANARVAGLQQLMAKYRAQAPPAHQHVVAALQQYMPTLQAAVMRGAPVVAVSQLIQRVERLGAGESLEPPLAQQVQHIATTLKGLPATKQDENTVSIDELRAMERRGRQLNVKQVHELARDVAPHLRD